MGNLNILGGDFLPRRSAYRFKSFHLVAPTGNRFFSASRKEKIPASAMLELEVKNEQSTRKFSGAMGKGIVGGVLFGPIGAGAGLLTGGHGAKVTFAITFTDGRHLHAGTDSATFQKIQTAYLNAKLKREREPAENRVVMPKSEAGYVRIIVSAALSIGLAAILTHFLFGGFKPEVMTSPAFIIASVIMLMINVEIS